MPWARASVTATARSDFTGGSGTATIPAGAMRTTVSVALLPDELEEGDETLAAILSDPTGAIILDGSGRWNPSALEGDLR